MNLLERFKMKLKIRAEKRFMESWKITCCCGGDIIHGRNYPIFYQRLTLIQQLMPLLIDEVKYFFKRQSEVALTDAIRGWQRYLEMQRLENLLNVGDIIHGRNYKSYPPISALFPITLRQEER